MNLLLVSLCFLGILPASLQGERATQNQTTPEASAPRVTVKGETMEKMLVRKVTPCYPIAARQLRISGTAKLRIVVDVDGAVKQVDFVSGPSEFARCSIDAVRQWKYKPQTAEGHPVEVETTVDIVFSLVQ